MLPQARLVETFVVLLVVAVSLVLIMANRRVASVLPSWAAKPSSSVAVYWSRWLLLAGTQIFASQAKAVTRRPAAAAFSQTACVETSVPGALPNTAFKQAEELAKEASEHALKNDVAAPT